MPDSERRADGAARIAGRRLHIDALERRHPPHFAVGDRVHGAAAGERQVRQTVLLLQLADEMEEGLLVHRLHRAGDVAMSVARAARRLAARAEQLLELGREQIADLRRAASPVIGDLLAMVAEVSEVELRSRRRSQAARSSASRRRKLGWP